ncbi:hypothetical protein DICPUDRAFT_97029 [Dictyostelium purpureum]|uniref:PPM-type phosphatase domain-containing protein n=1 Tax=Dictyostelium purpureum TaxID=5786 RepID=F0ZDD3_DICPU|nr:uncharacterized protein DICPUDRAFT_97029 [Dictyostelium purpureum]EGC38022.1 hypothetical protein DICPUDRAFT_97029 [Dictyostelium purpureum]|eukprot:XP_003285423.1 hypothetical protein DICPUDRAFT_97029 [Dictyostelium purpureum]
MTNTFNGESLTTTESTEKKYQLLLENQRLLLEENLKLKTDLYEMKQKYESNTKNINISSSPRQINYSSSPPNSNNSSYSSTSSATITLATSPSSTPPLVSNNHHSIANNQSYSSSEDLKGHKKESLSLSISSRENSNGGRDLTNDNSRDGKKKSGRLKLFKFLDPKQKQNKKEINHQELLLPGSSNEADFIYKETKLSTPYLNLPKLEVLPLKGDRNKLVQFSGPDYVNTIETPVTNIGTPMVSYPASYGERVYCISTSTYPFLPGTTQRAGDPIADRYTCAVYNNRLIACLADGCNWGEKPKEAAQNASTAFIEYVTSQNDSMTNVKEVGKILYQGFECAHKSIMVGKDEFWEAGTTTLLGGVLLEINKGNDKWSPQWEFVCASVGDCKAFLISQGEVTDITEGNRSNLDAKDCGGRLGPHLEQGKPDLRNLNIFCASIYDDDIILIVSDGVHDNLDPRHLGKMPQDMSKEFNLIGEKWTDCDFSKSQIAKNAFTSSLLETLTADTTDPSEISNRILKHCWDTTVASRHWMETNSGKRLPEDYSLYPGKMDHTSIICFKAGQFKSQKDDNNDNDNYPITSTSSQPIKIQSPTNDNNNNINNGIGSSPISCQTRTPTMPQADTITVCGEPRTLKASNHEGGWIKISPSRNVTSPLKKINSDPNLNNSSSSVLIFNNQNNGSNSIDLIMRNFEFVTPPPTYAPQMGYNNHYQGYPNNYNMIGVPQPPMIMTPQPPMMMVPPPMMMGVPQPTAASFIPQTAPIIPTPPMMMGVPPPPMMMGAPQPTAASYIPSHSPVTSPGYGVTPELVVPFSTNTMVYNGNPYYR